MQHDFHLLAGGAQTIDVAGKFFKYKSGVGAIRVKDNRGGTIDLLPGQGVWNVEYNSLSVQDISGAVNSGVLLAGDFDFHDDRISGTVDVIDGGRARTNAGAAFMGTAGIGALAAANSYAQIWNPVGSGKKLIIEKAAFSVAPAAAQIGFGIIASALTTVDVLPQSKLSGGAASVAQMRNQQTATQLIPIFMGSAFIQASSTFLMPLSEPIVIAPGYGLAVECLIVNNLCSAMFEYFEESL